MPESLRQKLLSSASAISRMSGMIAALSVGPLFHNVAFAQNETTDTDQTVNENLEDTLKFDTIVVTARKREESLQDTPIAISAFSGENLDARGASNISNIEQFAPSVIFDTSEGIGGGSSAQVFIRGIGQSDFNIGTEPGVGIYLDGVYLGRTPGSVLELVDVERVEVLRGPQGTLFGRNTIGGAVSLVSRTPSDEFGGRVSVTGGTDARFDGKAYIDVPITDQLLSKVSLLYKRQDGFVKVLNSGEELGDVDVFTARGDVVWEPSDDLSFSFSGDYTTQRQNGAPTTGLFFDDTFLPASPTPPGVPNSGAPFPIATIAGFYNVAAQNGIPGSPFGPPPPGFDIFGQALVNADGNCPIAIGAVSPADAIDPNGSQVSDTTNANCFNNQFNTGDLFTTFGSDTVNNVDSFGFALTGEWNLTANLTLKSITSYRDLETRTTNDIDNSPLPVGETENNINQDQFSQELQLLGSYDRLQFVAGIYYFQENASDTGQITTGSGNFINGAIIDNDAFAVYGQFTYDVTDRLHLTAGGRYTEENKSFTPLSNYVTNFFIPGPFFLLPENENLVSGIGLPGPGGQDGSGPFDLTPDGLGCLANPDGSGVCFAGTQHLPPIDLQQDIGEFVPYVNIGFDLTEDILIYASYSEGFKSGGGNQRAIFPSTDPSFLLFGPEFVDVYEGGIKSSWFDNRLIFNAAAYFTEYDDIQVNVQLGFVPTVQNAGDAEIFGLEFESSARPIPNLELTGSLAYTDADYTSLDPTAVVTLDNEFANTPKWSGSIGAAYFLDLPNGMLLTPRIDYSYKSEIFNDAENNPELRQPGTGILNLNVSLESSNNAWLLSAGVTNVTDEEIITAGFRNTVGGFGQGIVARDRAYFVQLEHRF